MDANAIMTLVGSLGFPVCMCIAMFYRMGKQDEQHKEEMAKLSESVNNNTLAITQLTAKLEQSVSDK